jgi:membrane-bound inhibitor of C-type lysozyme
VIRALIVALAFAGAAEAQGLSADSRTYLCAGGAVLRVAYLNPAEGERFAVVDWAGALVPMRAVRTGSGAFYVDFDEQRGLRWRTKGEEGFLARLAADHTAREETLLGDCRAP